MRLGLARAIGKCAGSGCKARGAARGGTTGKPCNAADAPAHRSAGTAKYNGCARAKCLANPSGPGRFPLMRRCRLLIGYLPNLVGSALPEGKSATVAATRNTQTGSPSCVRRRAQLFFFIRDKKRAGVVKLPPFCLANLRRYD